MTDKNSKDFGKFTVNITTLNLFDADNQLPEMANRIHSMATGMNKYGNITAELCHTLLEEFHTASSPNSSRQLSVDEVGQAVHTDIKLDLHEIAIKYDGLPELAAKNPFEPGGQADREVWEPYFAYQAELGPPECETVNCTVDLLTTPMVILENEKLGQKYIAMECRMFMDTLLQQYEVTWRKEVKPSK